MIGFVLGIAVGLIWGPGAKALNPLGTILTRLLTMVVAPLVLCLLVCAAADVGDGKKLGRMGVKTVVCFLLSTAIAIVLGLVMSNIIGVGTGVTIQQTTQAASSAKEVSMLDTLINIIPNNPFEALSKQNLLQIIFRAGQEAMKEITNIVLEFTPYGVFGLMVGVIGRVNPFRFLRTMKEAMAFVFATC